MTLIRRMLILLFLASLLFSAAFVFLQHEDRRAQLLDEEKNMLARTEQELARLDRELSRFEAARGRFSPTDGLARHEKVAVAARLSPAELARLNELLRHAYAGDGFFLFKNFSLRWSGERELSLEMIGEKIFLR